MHISRPVYSTLSLADSKIVVIKEIPGGAMKRYNTQQVKQYVEYSEEVAASFTLSLNKAIANYRDISESGAY